MDPNFSGLPDFINGFNVDDQNQTLTPDSSEFSTLLEDYKFDTLSPDLNFLGNPFIPVDLEPETVTPPITVVSPEGDSSAPSSDTLSMPSNSLSPGGDSSSDDSDFSETVFKYMNQILMEENIEEKPSMFFDPLGLKDTEKSFYDALGQKYPPSPNQYSYHIDHNSSSPDDFFSGSSNSSTMTSSSTDSQWIADPGEYKPYFSQIPVPGDYVFQSNLQPSSQFSANPLSTTVASIGDGVMGSSVNELFAQNFFSNSDSALQFRRGLEEASKFLPKSNQLVIDLESPQSNMVYPEWKREDLKVEVKVEKGEKENSPDGSRGRKNHEREEIELEEGRTNKQSAVYVDESELSEMFDKVLLCTDAPSSICGDDEALQNEASKTLQPNGQPQGANSGKSRGKKQGRKNDTVDLRNLLILCAQAVSANDRRTANELLKQIRQHSSPLGDGSQRVAHIFANGLEARLAGSGTQFFYTSLVSKRTSAIEILKSYQVNLSACPFKRISTFFTIKMIYKALGEATSLHIVDFGIQYGFQWPILIQLLSKRPGGAPKLRVTGIDLPQPGFRPAERIEETGRRLEKYCERFSVPFQYNAIASQNWETIQIKELKIDRNEVLAVNSWFKFKNLLDETVEETSPRNAVLNLIRRMNPNIFVHSIVNGSYNAPFFVTRFREALFHFSALYDIFDVTISRENEERLMFEREFYGREAMNVIASEGLQRVERPETYKQWSVRTTRAGFKQLPLDQELMNKFRAKVKAWYHKDFVLDEDNRWMLQGWKGRIVYASTCWVPA